jgi:hypothetical protein
MLPASVHCAVVNALLYIDKASGLGSTWNLNPSVIDRLTPSGEVQRVNAIQTQHTVIRILQSYITVINPQLP